MESFRVVHTPAEDWAHAAKICADGICRDKAGYNLGFLYVTDLLADDLSSILTYLRQKTGIAHWVGSIGIGICANDGKGILGDYYESSAVAVMAAQLGDEQFQTLSTIKEEFQQLPGKTLDWMKSTGAPFGVVHGDPSNGNISGLVQELADFNSSFLVGGLTSSRGNAYQIAGRVTGGGLSGVMFSPDVEVMTAMSQGCLPISETHVISDCLDNILIGLDGERALDVFREDIGTDLSEDLSQVAGLIHAGIPIEGSDTGDFMVRGLLGIDTDRGWLAIGEQVNPGDRLLFVRRDADSAKADLQKALEHLKKRLDRPPRGGLYFSCLGRGPALFEEEALEMTLIRDVLGDIPMIGFYGNGEISNDRLYGYTGVLVLFR